LARAAAMKSVRRNSLWRMRGLSWPFFFSSAPHWVQNLACGRLVALHSGQWLSMECIIQGSPRQNNNCHGNTRKDTELIPKGIYFSVFFRVLPWQKDFSACFFVFFRGFRGNLYLLSRCCEYNQKVT
jgi:hypothetical protein